MTEAAFSRNKENNRKPLELVSLERINQFIRAEMVGSLLSIELELQDLGSSPALVQRGFTMLL
jgi:hypothetical protein